MRLEAHPKLLEEGPAAVLWAILDKIVHDCAPVVEGLETDIEEVAQRDLLSTILRADMAVTASSTCRSSAGRWRTRARSY